MRRGEIFFAISILIATCTMVFASTALAAGGTPSDICKDLADGHLNGSYTKQQLASFLNDPTVQGYCGAIATGVDAQVAGGGQAPGSQQPGQVKGARHTSVGPSRSTAAPLASTKPTGSLPFTGAELALFALVGLALIGTGLLLRTTARQRS